MTRCVLCVLQCCWKLLTELSSSIRAVLGLHQSVPLKPWSHFVTSQFPNLTMPLNKYRKPVLLHSPLYLITSVGRGRRLIHIIILLISASVYALAIFYSPVLGISCCYQWERRYGKGNFTWDHVHLLCHRLNIPFLAQNSLLTRAMACRFLTLMCHLWELDSSLNSHQGHWSSSALKMKSVIAVLQ